MSYVYIKTEPQLWTVGFYDPKGEWHSESDYANPGQAAKRVAWLNGGSKRVIHPVTILETYSEDTSWNDNTMLAIVCDFIHEQEITYPHLLEQFRAYVAERAKEDNEGEGFDHDDGDTELDPPRGG